MILLHFVSNVVTSINSVCNYSYNDIILCFYNLNSFVNIIKNTIKKNSDDEEEVDI